MAKLKIPLLLLLLLTAFAVFHAGGTALAGSLREDFIQGYRAYQFKQLEVLVMKNKPVIPGEVRALIKEASAEGIGFQERMELLDIASAMASMHLHWHADPGPLAEVEAAQKEEMRKENDRLAHIEKWKKYELYPGNILMRGKEKEYAPMGLAPVVFPHWAHRFYYACKACHNYIFEMRRGASDITQAGMLEGKSCGVCHNGKVAFGAGENCGRCHSPGTDNEGRTLDSKGADLEGIKAAARRLGSGWDPEKLAGGKLPHDRFGFVDWTELGKAGAYKPIRTLRAEDDEGLRDGTILFEPKMAGINGVPFSHRTHSEQINCSSCHPEEFTPEAGANRIDVITMADGKYCGLCHGKASFKLSDCNRCHTIPKDAPREGMLKRN